MTQPLPKYEDISIDKILPASTILFYGGNKLTELFGNKFDKHPYKPPAFHAAFYIRDGLFLNVGKFKVVQKLADEFRSTRRIDVITYNDIPADVRAKLCDTAFLDVSKPKVGLSLPDYDWVGYLRFALKFLKPTKRKDFCSDNVVDLFKEAGYETSYKPDESTAPWHLYEYALARPDRCAVRTLWKGTEFKG